MANEFDAMKIQDFAHDVASGLDEAAIIARTSDRTCKQGLTERAFQSLFDIEPLIHEASILLEASLYVRRRDRERGINPD